MAEERAHEGAEGAGSSGEGDAGPLAAPVRRKPPKPFTRWTADTAQAFLLALRLAGQVRKAAAQIGRSSQSAYDRRRRDPDFAAAWDAAVAAQQAEWIAVEQAPSGGALALATRDGGIDDAAVDTGHLLRWRERRDGWRREKRRLFLRTLAHTKEVRAACAAAKMSSTSAYYLRANSPPFARAWERALGRELRSIDQAAYERAVEGWDEVVMRGGEVVSVKRRYSDGLLRDLMRRAREGAAVPAKAEGAASDPVAAKAKADVKARRGESDPQGGYWKNAAQRYAHEVAKAAGGVFTLKALPDDVDAAILAKAAALDRVRARERTEDEAALWAAWQDAWGEMGRG